MIEEKRITTPQELKKYIGKLVITHYTYNGNFIESFRILTSIKDSRDEDIKEDRPSLDECRVYGKFILRRKIKGKGGTLEGYFCAETRPLYSNNLDYVRLPTTKEKHEFMERLIKYNLENNAIHIV